MSFDLAARTAAFRSLAATQPGCTPYDNHRPIRVNRRSAGQTLAQLLSQVRPFSLDPDRMEAHPAWSRLTVDHKRPDPDQVMVSGNIIRLVVPDTVEPLVSPELQVLHEDAHLLVVHKPAPLPVHPSGRFNKNTLLWIGRAAWPDLQLKTVHRLDADTTGLLVCAKNGAVAHALGISFRERRVRKSYLARVHGQPSKPTFSIEAPITDAPSRAGTRRVAADGRAALTQVQLVEVLSDGTSLLGVHPHTGRTHQIRLHLHTAGLPIVGDTAYAPEPVLGTGLSPSSGRLCLHAHRLGFPHPETGEWMEFESPPPAHFAPDRRPPPKWTARSP